MFENGLKEDVIQRQMQKTLFEALVWEINGTGLRYTIYNQNAKSVSDMIKFVMSCSTELGMNLRPSLKEFNTKALELVDGITRTKLISKTFN